MLNFPFKLKAGKLRDKNSKRTKDEIIPKKFDCRL